MAATLNGIAIAWTVHHHDTAAPCCEVTVTVTYSDTKLTAKDGSHNFTLSESVSSQKLAAVIDSPLEASLTSKLQTYAANKFGLTLAQVQALTTRTVSSDYPAGS